MISYADEALFQQDSIDKTMYLTWNRQLQTVEQAYDFFKSNNPAPAGLAFKYDRADYNFDTFWGDSAFNMDHIFFRGFRGSAVTLYGRIAVVSDYGPVNCTFSIINNSQLKITTGNNNKIRVICVAASWSYYYYQFCWINTYTPVNGVVNLPQTDMCVDQIWSTYHATCECITNKDLAAESFALTQKLTADGGFSLGECNSSFIEFTVGGWTSALLNKNLECWIIPKGGARFLVGKYTVTSDEPTADRRWRNVVAYDALQAVLNKDVTSWYNSLLPNENSSCTVKQFRDSFFSNVGITQVSATLVNDSVTVTRTIEPKQLSGKDVLNAICEINGCFGRINRDGKFQYVELTAPQGALYPAEDIYPANDLYPVEPSAGTAEIWNSLYLKAQYEDYKVNSIGSVQIRNDKNEIGVTVGSGTNIYLIEGNLLAFGHTTADMTTIANNILSKITGIIFRPASVTAVGDPCLEIGDNIHFTTKYTDVETIIFQRKLKGIQSLKDDYVSKSKKQSAEKNINSTQKQITKINGDVTEVKQDLIQAKKVIADEIEATNGKIDNLTAIAITTQNISTVTLNASQITAGTISTDRLDTGAIATQTVTATTISAALASPSQGTITVGTGRFAQIYWYTDTSGGGNPSYHVVKSQPDGSGKYFLYVD